MEGKPIYDFSDEWEEIQDVNWKWFMWNEPNTELIGWVLTLRDEELMDKKTGEIRKNLICYFITSTDEYLRFIVPTDLKFKLDKVNDRRLKVNADWEDVMLKIVYVGKEKTFKGYEIKRFKVYAKRSRIPDLILKRIPELPNPELPNNDNGFNDSDFEDLDINL
jgi:hypothetical protein